MVFMRNRDGRKGKRRIQYMITLVFVLAAGVLGFFGDSARAADEIFIMDQYGVVVNPATPIEMKTSTMQLDLRTTGTAYDDARYKVKWSIEDVEQQKIAKLVTSETSDPDVPPVSAKTRCLVKALSPGDVTVTVTVTDSMNGDAEIGSTTCNIRVIFSIDTTVDDSIFKKVNATDNDRSLVMYADHAPVQMKLNFGAADSTNTQWSSANEEVITVGQRDGIVKPVGAGKTRLIATYTPTGETDTYTAYLDVYIIPRVSDKNGGPYVKSEDIKINSGEYLYTDTDFSNNLEVVKSKIVWVVKQDDGHGNSAVIANSLGLNSDLIKITPTASRNNELQVEGMAGEYDVYFYTFGSYFSETNVTDAYTPTVVHLTLKSDIKDKEEILHIGDRYNFAEAYNMTVQDFIDCFTVTLSMAGDGGSADNYVDYNVNSASIDALQKGEVVAEIKVRSGKEDYVRKLLGLDPGDTVKTTFTTNLSIVERLSIDANNCVLGVGETRQLKLVFDGTIDGEIVWTSSDSNFVSVDENGLITGKKITTQDVTITATLRAGDGVERKATCIVKVEPEVSGFTLNPSEEQTMIIGEHITVVADIKQVVTMASLDWFSSDTSVFTVSAAADGKSCVITAVGGGTAVLTAYNYKNKESHTLRVTVRVPIETISFAHPDVSVGYYKGGYNMKNDVSYTPTNVTEAERRLQWASSDTSVATVDQDGYLTFTGAGTTLITVFPAYNPFNTMASCLVTVIGTPEKMTLNPTELTMNVGENKIIEVEYEPKNTVTGLTWTPAEPDIVTVEYDENRQMATLLGKAPGSTVINVVSTEGLISNVHVTVKQPSTGDITITPKELTLVTGTSQKLTTTLKPENSTDTLVWRSYNQSVARVDAEGNVTGVKEGNTFVEVRAYNGNVVTTVAVVQVTVRDGVKGISLDSYEKTIRVGDTITISPIFNPATAFNKEVKWAVSKGGVASIKASGVSNVQVTGVKAGTTLITGTTTDGGYSVACLITVVPKPTPSNTKVTVSPKTKYLKKGKSFYVTATVTGTSNKKVKWKSSKKKVCTVSSSGKVKGKKIGTAYITATARDGSGAYARCKVRVVRRVTKLTLNKYSARVLVGSTLKLKAKIKPKNATVKKLKWTSSDTTIATVDSSGRVMGLAEGMVKIRVKTIDGSNKSKTCIVRVMEPVDATGVDVANSEITVAKGRAIQSGIKVAPANATTKIKYHSDNKKVATVDKYGKIRTKRRGQATIYGRTANGKIGYCDVLVVDLNRKGLVMRQYDTEQLSVNLIKDGVTWYSKNINIATVSPTGLVTGRRKGKTTIYANVNGVKLGCRVRIKKIK